MSDYSQLVCVADRPSNYLLEIALRELETQAYNFAIIFINDSQLRLLYQSRIQQASNELIEQVARGEISIQAAAQRANSMRNAIMEATRLDLSSIGRHYSVAKKETGKLLEQLCQKYARERFSRDFTRLTEGERQIVYTEIVASAGRSQARVNAQVARWSRAGRGLVILSLGISVYNVIMAHDRTATAGREVSSLSGGFLGGMAGGAAFGLVCGPGAPVCVTIGAFVGGLAGSLGSEYLYNRFVTSSN